MTSSCRYIHHVQIGEIDARKANRPFEVLVSETGVNLDEAADITRKTSRSTNDAKNANGIAQGLGMFQMGPRTGNVIYNNKFANNLIEAVIQKCPNGYITGLTSIRETNKYPVISGEIVKVTGYCSK